MKLYILLSYSFFYLLAAVVSLTAIPSCVFADDEKITINIGCTKGDCTLQLRVSDNQQLPFLINGMPFDDHPSLSFRRKTEIGNAMKKFPHAVDCLSPEAHSDKGLDLARIDWERMRSNVEAAVCISHIVNVFRSAELTEVWLRELGFKVPHVITGSVLDEDSSTLCPVWKKDSDLYPLSWRDLSILPKRPYSLCVVIGGNGGVIDVSIIKNLS